MNHADYEKLVKEISSCTKCRLHLSRKKAVPGEGTLNPKIMFIGEAPGSKEDESGRPFVGAAGQLLTKLIEGIGLRREDVYITNVVKCRPPNNRDPLDDEIEACLPYLKAQLAIIKPSFIVALGRHAAKTVMSLVNRKFVSMSKEHGTLYEAMLLDKKVKIVITFHPAAALYNPELKKALEDDFNSIKSYLVERERKLKSISLDEYIKA